MGKNQDLTPAATAAVASPLLEVRGLVKGYQALRPLRVRALKVREGDLLSLEGLDAPAAEMFVHLVTGAALPDEGDIAIFGRNTREVPDAQEWLQSLEGLGLVSGRAVLLDVLSVLQNIALPLTLEVDPIAEDVVATVESLAREAGLDAGVWHRPLGEADPEARLRVHIARALAPGPRLIVAEHPSAGLPRDAVSRVAGDLARLARARGAALVVLTADNELARALGGRMFGLVPRTGELSETGGLAQRVRRLFDR